MKKIIVPTDFSENIQKALEYALELFKNETCTFYLLYAFHNAPSSPRTKKNAKEDLDQLISSLNVQDNTGTHHFEAIIETESVLNLTNKTQINKAADFIFIGTKGSSTLREIFVGSNALDLINYIQNCPVVVVPSKFDYTSLNEIIFATDFRHTFSNRELTPLLTIAKLHETRVKVAHIKTEEVLSATQKSNKELLISALKGTQHRFFDVDMSDTVASSLYEVEKENKNMGMLAILRTKHGFFQQLTRENIVKNIAFKTKIPLMVLPQIT